jgi:hypothetical protein
VVVGAVVVGLVGSAVVVVVVVAGTVGDEGPVDDVDDVDEAAGLAVGGVAPNACALPTNAHTSVTETDSVRLTCRTRDEAAVDRPPFRWRPTSASVN